MMKSGVKNLAPSHKTAPFPLNAQILFRFWGIIAAFLIFLPLHSQEYSLRTFSVDAGLAQSQVYASLVDSRGLLWFGTRGGGLSMFDGIQFRTLSEQDGLISNYILAIYEDKKGNLWVGTDEGVSRYDGQEFLNFDGSNGMKNALVNAIMAGPDGNLWLGTNNGIDVLDPEKGEIIKHYGKAEGLVHRQVTALLTDSKGNIWIGTFGGMNVLPAGKEFFRSNLHQFDRYRGLPDSHIRNFMEDSQGQVWICTYGGGAAWYDPQKSSLSKNRPFRYLGTANGLTSPIVFCATEDSKGNIWFGTLSGGAQRWNGKYFTYFTQNEGLYSNHVRSIVEDDWGNVWLGTSGGGVSKFSGDQFVHFTEKNGLPGNRVYSVVEDSLGHYWFGTSGGGITRYDGAEFTQFGRKDGFRDIIVKASFRDSKGNLWFGTEGAGAFKYDGKRFRGYSRSDGLSGNWVKQIIEDNAGNMWFATAGGGVSVLKNGKFQNYHVNQGLPSERINCIIQDRRGNIWIGSADRGIARFDGNKFTAFDEEKGLCSNIIRSVEMDKEGNLWWGTANGLSKLMQKSGGEVEFTCVTKKDGLTSENIYLTIFDRVGNLWSGTERGVDKVILNRDGNIREIRQYGATEGFTGIETCQRAALRDNEGNLWFGTINGITRHDPRENSRNQLPPRIHISNVNLFYSRLTGTQYADSVTPWYGLPMNLVLPHNQNHLSFEFIGINHKNPQKVSYKWKLEPYEKDWRPLTFKREATYSNLEPGEYTFNLKAYNEDGVPTKDPVEFHFVIRPPWYATWWFRIGAGLLVILLVFGGFRFRIGQIRKENEVQQRKVTMEKQMLELEQKALRLQMNPHFIFNALNSIKGCMAANDIPAARKYLVKFAKLMRLILDNSREAWISVETEVKTLELYLDLEKLSKSDKFDYQFEVDEAINASAIGIPPMIIQPFVENSVIHGVSALKEGGLITIIFRKEGDGLTAIVRDNGIGREAAIERKNQSKGTVHKSKGISVTEERLQLLQETDLADYKVTFRDLKNEDGSAAGTEVEILMPFEEM